MVTRPRTQEWKTSPGSSILLPRDSPGVSTCKDGKQKWKLKCSSDNREVKAESSLREGLSAQKGSMAFLLTRTESVPEDV